MGFLTRTRRRLFIRKKQRALRPAVPLAQIEARMKASPNQVEIPTEHIFSAGIYVRKVVIPANTIVMGKRHRLSTCNILLKGVLQVYVDEGAPPITITGPYIFTSPPGAKKFAYCVEEATFVNVIPTELTDPDEIEKLVIIPEQEYLEQKGGARCLS